MEQEQTTEPTSTSTEPLSTSTLTRRRKRSAKSGCNNERARKFVYDWYGPFPHFPDAPFLAWPKLFLLEVLANWKSGLTVALVATPLSVSLALAAQATPVMGIITAVWTGIATSLLGGSDYNISGPTGVLSGILTVYAVQYGVSVLPLLALISGIMMIVVTALRLDIYIMFIPSAVMEGFSVAAAAIISGNQIQLAFGLPKGIPRHEEFYMNIYESLAHMSHANSLATFMFISTTAALLILIRWAPTVPWSIFMVVISIMLGMSVDGTDSGWAKVQTLKSRYGELHLRLFDFSIPSFPAPRDIYTTQTQTFWALMYASVSVTFVALLGTLIAARVADRLTATKFAQAREVFGCGVANLLSGVFGGVPGGAALARTSLNIKSGATSRMSGAISAVAIMVISMALLEYFRYLQLPVIAAILVVVAIRMIEVKQLYHMYLYDKKTFGIAMFTAVVCILKDPTDGVILGGVLSLFIYAKANSQAYGEVEVAVSKEQRITSARSAADIDEESAERALQKLSDSYKRMLVFRKQEQASVEENVEKLEEDTLIYKFPSELTYLNAPAHIDRAKTLHSKFAHVILSCRSLFYVDMDGVGSFEALNDIIGEFERHNKQVLLAAVSEDVRDQLKHSRFFEGKVAAGQVLPTEVECLYYIAEREHQANTTMLEEDHSYGVPASDDDQVQPQLASMSRRTVPQYSDDDDDEEELGLQQVVIEEPTAANAEPVTLKRRTIRVVDSLPNDEEEPMVPEFQNVGDYSDIEEQEDPTVPLEEQPTDGLSDEQAAEAEENVAPNEETKEHENPETVSTAVVQEDEVEAVPVEEPPQPAAEFPAEVVDVSLDVKDPAVEDAQLTDEQPLIDSASEQKQDVLCQSSAAYVNHDDGDDDVNPIPLDEIGDTISEVGDTKQTTTTEEKDEESIPLDDLAVHP